MKFRHGFVSNSSSSSFWITNKTNATLRLAEFVKENPQLIEEFRAEYDWNKETDLHHTEKLTYTQEGMIESAEKNNVDLEKGAQEVVFGDEHGTLIGAVFDYILRDGGESKRFSWKFKEYYR